MSSSLLNLIFQLDYLSIELHNQITPNLFEDFHFGILIHDMFQHTSASSDGFDEATVYSEAS